MNDNSRGDPGATSNAGEEGERLVSLRRRGRPEYWRSIEERQQRHAPTGEFVEGLPGGPGPAAASRRDFLSLMGFTLGAAGVSACRAPVQNAIPMPTAAEAVPGVSSWYATTCGGCSSACSLLVKQRDGRPIKIEGNAQSALFGGGVCATGQATVLSLYDDGRLPGPRWQGRPARWSEIDERVATHLAEAERDRRPVVLLSGTITSPSTRALVAEFGARFPGFRHVTYDAVSASALRVANGQCFGKAVVPHYRFDRAKVIVGLEADFLGTWLSPVEFSRAYREGRGAEEARSLHVQCESGLSVTGSNADLRVAVPPSALGAVASALLGRIASRAGASEVAPSHDPIDPRTLDRVADALWSHRGQSLVVSARNDVALQTVVNALNAALGNIGKTIELSRPSLQRQGDDPAVAALIDDLASGAVHTLILYGVNPAYDHPQRARFLEGLARVALSISFADRADETGAHVHALCPDHHFLEAWGDAEPVESHLGLAQPTIAPLRDTRAAQESLLRWMGQPSDYYAYLRAFWRRRIFPRTGEQVSFDEFWDRSLQQGVVDLPRAPREEAAKIGIGCTAPARKLAEANLRTRAGAGGSYELHLCESVPLRDGRHANNPWLQELPDPITKVTWGNCAAVSPQLARHLEVKEGDVLSIKSGSAEIALPVFIQPGQDGRTVSVALGYGRDKAGRVASGVGANAFPLMPLVGGFRADFVPGVTLRKTGRHVALATTQSHFSMEGRPIVLETTPHELRLSAERSREAPEALPTLWADRPHGEHRWGMAIDLDACTGCSACVVACQAENNVPVVGKDQVQRTRIMHWIRIDRYYHGDEEDPRTVHQPMMCQHCGHAPCETVCPVLATSTSSEGLNQQVYNRCIGTRYCANNCPYKVRRFNWYEYANDPDFDFHMKSPLGRMVLNPDVTVRSRGVMEKCTLCVQRIQLGKNLALQGKRSIADGDIQTACQQTCPSQAIVFGDLMDPASRVSRLLAGPRAYRVLDELGTRPNVGYLKKVRGQGPA
jgi:molybdopterin-containing oxidoreductase family iron-sulfur binding subunit